MVVCCCIVFARTANLPVLFPPVWLVRKPDRIFFSFLQAVLLRFLDRFPKLQFFPAVDVSTLLLLGLLLFLLECLLVPGLLRTLFLVLLLESSFLACMLLCLLAFVLFVVCLDLSIVPNCFHPRLQCLVLVLVFDCLSAVALVVVCLAQVALVVAQMVLEGSQVEGEQVVVVVVCLFVLVGGFACFCIGCCFGRC